MQPSPHRILVVGAGPAARALGQVLARTNDVCLVDRNREHCAFAEAAGLPAVCGSALDDAVLASAGASTARTAIVLTPNAEVNALAAQRLRAVFGIREILLRHGSDADGHAELRAHLGATTLFGGAVALSAWDYWIEHELVERQGLTLKRTLTPARLFTELQAYRPSLPLAVRRGDAYLPFHDALALAHEDRVILLRSGAKPTVSYDRFDRLVARCPVLDVDRAMSAEAFFGLAAAALSAPLDLPPDVLTARFLDRETASSTVILPGLAIPHVLIEGAGRFEVLVARSRDGISFPGQRERVHAVFVLVRTAEERNFHLRALAAIAQVVQDPSFEPQWLTAAGPEDLRRLVLDAERRRFPEPVRTRSHR